LIAEILHQLIGLFHYLQGVLYISGGAGYLPSAVAPGNGWLEYDWFLLGCPIFRGELLVLGRVLECIVKP